MGQKKNEAPTPVELSPAEVSELKERLKKQELNATDIEKLLGLIAFCQWMQQRLARAKLSIKRLRQLFGFKNESRKRSKKLRGDAKERPSNEDMKSDATTDSINPEETNTTVESPEDAPENKTNITLPQWDPEKNHGRYAAAEYWGCPIVDVPFDDELLKANKCPHCAACNTEATVYPEAPTVLVFLDSQPLISGEQFHLQKGRCGICKTYFSATKPSDLKNRSKYSPQSISTLAITHYYAGLPFKRIETLQKAQGVPLADATQYDLMERLHRETLMPVANVLKLYAANGSAFYYDDTPGNILEQTRQENSGHSGNNKKSIHTTALLSEYEGHRIYLFNTNTLSSGKEFSKLLQKRTTDDVFITMSDASSSNFPDLNEHLAARWIISLCLAHGRRRFVELLEEADDDTQLVLDIISQVYQHESHCKRQQLNALERLDYHQLQCKPLMDALHTWLNNLMLYKKIEPNSQLGETVNYLLKRWHWFTQFLRIPGAQLDNNICEQAIKVVIRYRKNSLFYKTFYGATVGDAIMSILHTAAFAGANIFDYLTVLQQHTQEVASAPENWLPWNYQQTLDSLELVPVEAAATG